MAARANLRANRPGFATAVDPLVIVGTGLAGYTLAREWRRLVPDAPLVMLSRDGGELYSKPMISAALASGKGAADLATASAPQMAAQLGAEVRTRCPVSAIDTLRHSARVDGADVPYSRLVLALGADPIRLPLTGDGAADVLAVNDLEGYGRFRTALEGHRRVLILGAGLIGCEFANDLAAAGYSVAIADPASWPLARLLPQAVGTALRDRLAAIGVRWHLGTGVESVERAGDLLRVRLDDGESVEAEVALSAVGLRPRTTVAAEAGLTVNRGIVVGRDLATTAPSVFALGDCAEVCGLILPYVLPIMHAARALARTLAGEPTPVTYPAMPVVVKTPAWPTVVAPAPAGSEGDWAETDVTSGGARALYRGKDGRLLGFALSGEAVAEKNRYGRELPAVLG